MKALEERRKDLMASYPVWKKMTLYQGLASKAAECPNHVFLLVEGRRYTYGEVLRAPWDLPGAAVWPLP